MRQFGPRTVAGWTAFMLLTAGSFRFVPGFRVTAELWVLICGALTFAAVRAWPQRPHPFERYVLFMMCYLPLASAVAAFRSFGQPLHFGLLQARGLLVCGAALHLLRLAREDRLDLDVLERAFRATAVLMTLYGLLLRLLVDTSRMDDIPGFYDSFSGDLASDATFVVFGALYFAIDALVRGAGRSAVLALGMLTYLIVIDGGRFQLVSTAAALTFAGLWLASPRQRVLFIGSVVVLPPVLLGALAWLAPARAQDLAFAFQDAWFVLVTGEQGLDISANSRLLQFDLALPFVLEHPWFGNGFLSAQWQGGFEGVLGYLHPTDTGLFGVVFVYGAVGLALTLWQLSYAFRAMRVIRPAQQTPLVRGVVAFLVFWSVFTLTSARLSLLFDWSVFVVGLLVAAELIERRRAQAIIASPEPARA